MADLDSIRRLITDTVPFSRVLGVQVVAVGAGRAEALLPASPERLNHVGTVHAVAQFGLGETTSGAVLMSTFDDLGAQGIVPVAANVSIAYHRPARGDLRAVAEIGEGEQRRIREEIAQTGRARVSVAVALTDLLGTVTTDCTIDWVLLKPRPVLE